MSVKTREHFLWVEKYRPKTVADCIIPANLKTTFLKMQDQGDVSNLLLCGGAGCGKTTVARALLEFLKADYCIINGSLNGGIDTLRVGIANFASSVSFKGSRKYVILDEADYLTHATQPALRNFLEEYSKNCGFILTANYRNKIILPLQSRCSVIEFDFPKKDQPALAKQFFNRVKEILKTENIEYDNNAVIAIILRYFPDCRRVLNELQRYSVNGKIDSGIIHKATQINDLIKFLQDKDYTRVRNWVAENLNNSGDEIFRTFYDEAGEHFTPSYIPELILTIAKYQFQGAFALDHQINLSACLAEIMVSAEWK